MLLDFHTEQDWLEARKRDVTATEVAALFGLHPFKSRLRLWQEKRGDIEVEFVESDQAKWGRRLQIPIAMGICEDRGWSGEDLTGYYFRHDARRLGASPDVKAEHDDWGRICMEIKLVDFMREADGWFKDRAPLHYEFQLQTQMHLGTGYFDCGCIGALGQRQAARVMMREYDAEVGAMIDEEVDGFWQSIENNVAPAPDYAVDGPLLERLRRPQINGWVINLSTNNRAVDLIQSYALLEAERKPLREQLKEIEAAQDMIKNEIHDMMGENEIALIGEYQVGARVQEVLGDWRDGYTFRRFDVSTLKKGRKK